MALTTDPSGAPAPKGGFQQGGWYSGYQYYNGTFGVKGAINSQSPQQGAGQAVSSEVNAQSAKAQGVSTQNFNAYLQKPATQTAPSVASTGSTDKTGVQAYLDNYQAGANSVVSGITSTANKTDEQILAEVKSALTPNTPMPTAPNLTSTYQGYLASMGINDLNTHAANLKAQIADVQSQIEAQSAAEEAKGGTVPLNVIAGRQTEEQRQAQVKLDSLNLQLGVVTDQINTQMNSINTIMQFTQQDYTNALGAWQAEFDVNSKIYDAFTTAKQNQVSNQLQEASLNLEVQKAAASNFQTIANLIASGNMPSFDNMSPDQQSQVAQLETQAGLPIGTLSSIQMSAKDRLLYTSSYRGQVTAIVQGQDGQLTTQTFGNLQPLAGSSSQQEADSAIASYQWQKDSQGNSISPFMQFVADYANSMTLNQIYKMYMQSPQGQKYGSPTEDPQQIQNVYDAARGSR